METDHYRNYKFRIKCFLCQRYGGMKNFEFVPNNLEVMETYTSGNYGYK